MSTNNLNDAVNKAKEAAAKAQEYSNRKQREEERAERIRRDQERRKIPLVSPVGKREQPSTSINRKPKTKKASSRVQQASVYPYQQAGQSDFNQEKDESGQGEVAYHKNSYGRAISKIIMILSLGLLAIIWLYNVLPFKSRMIFTASLLILVLVLLTLSKKGHYSKSARSATSVIGTISLVILLLITYLLLTGIGFLNSLYLRHDTVEYEIRVMQSSPLQSLAELDGGVIASSDLEKEKDLEQAIDNIRSDNNLTTLTMQTFSDYIEATGALYTGQTDAMLYNKAYLESLRLTYPEFEQETRVLGTTKVKIKVKQLLKSVNTSKDAFNMYISGIDSYGDLTMVSRSDVNIIMTVDPRTKTILLTNIPRDTYLPIYGTPGSDKLTHAGIYGIESSVGTISQFLATDINYFTRVNFTSLIELVDALGGIEVDNPEAFTSWDGHWFPQGRISLNGEEALAFSRERKSLSEGDIGRGKNQLRVIEGMVNKAISPEVIPYANELMNRFNEVAQTNMPTKDISNLINVQLSDNSSWKFETITLKGSGTMELPSYAMPGQALYMYQPDQGSVFEIQQKIKEIVD